MVSLSRLLVLFFLVMVFVLALRNTLLAQTRSYGSEQTSGTSQGSSDQPTAPAGGSSGRAPALVVPYISVSERYDSNVLFRPTNKQEDYVTKITAGAHVNYRDDMVAATLRGGLTSEVYVRNPGLNFIGTNASLNAVLDNAVGRVVRGLGLSISDAVVYSPKPQAWLTPEVAENSFISGLQIRRNNTLTNVSNILSTYALNPSDQIMASYSYQMIRFYNTQTTVPGAVGSLFNTNVHILSTGLEHHINSTDSIGVSYRYQQMSFEPNTGGPSFGVAVNGAMATWKQAITREWTVVVSPGAAILSSLPGELQWTMQTSLQWHDAKTIAEISYSRSILPAFFLAGSAMISDGVTLLLSRNITSQWSVGAQGNYRTSRSIGSTRGNFRFESYGGRGFVDYTFYPGLVASATVTHDEFTFGQTDSLNEMNRQTAQLSLTAEWN